MGGRGDGGGRKAEARRRVAARRVLSSNRHRATLVSLTQLLVMSSELPAEDISVAFVELAVPSEFANYDETTASDTIVHLETWKRKAYTVLSSLRDQLRARAALDTRTQAEVLWYVAAFDGEDPWVLEESRELARGASLSLSLPASA